jgi:hypothetical protein
VIKKREERQEEKKMSLKDLLPKHSPARKSPDLTELRRTLEKSLISDTDSDEELKSPKHSAEAGATGQAKKKILKPGDTIKF